MLWESQLMLFLTLLRMGSCHGFSCEGWWFLALEVWKRRGISGMVLMIEGGGSFLSKSWLLKKVEFHLLWFCLVYIFVDRYFFYVLDSLMGMVSSVKVFFGYWIVKKGNDFSFGLDVFVLWSWYLKEDVYLSSCSFFCYVDDQWWIFW